MAVQGASLRTMATLRTEQAVQLVEQIGAGGVSLKDIAGLSRDDIAAVARVGASAIQAGRYDAAVKVFEALEALDASDPLHVLHLAIAHHRAAHRDEAIESLTRFLDADLPKELPDVARALLLRAELVGAHDRAAAARDLMAARALAARSPDVKKIVDGGAV